MTTNGANPTRTSASEDLRAAAAMLRQAAANLAEAMNRTERLGAASPPASHREQIQALVDTGDGGDLVDAIELSKDWIDEILARGDEEVGR